MARITRVVVEDGPVRAMEEVEGFMFAIGARIVKREVHCIRAAVNHPDGFDTDVSVNYHANDEDADVLEFVRCGDPILFEMICDMFVEFDMGRGVPPGDFYVGQILPRIYMTSSPPPLDVLDMPTLRLDGGGVKRKVADAAELL